MSLPETIFLEGRFLPRRIPEDDIEARSFPQKHLRECDGEMQVFHIPQVFHRIFELCDPKE